MNKLIKQQLQKCRVAPLPIWDDKTTHIVIPKLGDKNNRSFVPGRCYVIKLDDCLVHPPQGDALHQNWNNNIVPRYDCYKCECVAILNKMVRVSGWAFNQDTGTDIGYSWEGWLPLDKIEVIDDITV